MTDHEEADERPRRPVRRPAPAAAGNGGGVGPRWDDPNATAPPAAPDAPAAGAGGRGEAWSGTSAVDRRPVRRPRVTYTTSTGAGPTAAGAAPGAAGGGAPGGSGGPFMDANAWAAGLRNAEATQARPVPPRRQVIAPPGYEGLPGPVDGPDDDALPVPPRGYEGLPGPVDGPGGRALPAAPRRRPATGAAPPVPVLPTRVGVPGPLRNPVSPESTLPGVPPGALTPGVASGLAAGAGAAALAGGPPTGAWRPEATMPPAAAPTTAGWPSSETTQAHPAAPAPGGPGATGATGSPTAFSAGSPGPGAAPGAPGTYDAGYGEVRDPYGPWSPPPTGPDGLPLWEEEGDRPRSGRRAAAAPAGDDGPAPRRAGLGLLVGILGLAALVAGFVALPWATEGGQDASFLDLREAVTAAAPETPGAITSLAASGEGELAAGASGATGARAAQAPGETVPPGGDATTTVPAGAPPATAPTTLPGTPPASTGGAATSTVPGGATTPGATTAPQGASGDPTSTTAPTARPAPASPLDPSAGGRRADFAQMFVEYLWVVVIAVAAMAVVFTTLWVPRGRGGRMGTGLLMSGPVGFLANAVDRTGAVGPRVAGVAGTLAVAALYGAAVFAIFGREPAPEPALGVWVGEAGLAAVLVACLVGTPRARA